jgi:3-deoxy-D-manno-octulosonic-acid transferase
MGLWFRLADVAVMGGSFLGGIGGHNPLEPARLGAPPLTGPFAFNFTDVYGEMLAEQAALLADRPEDLTRLVHGLLSDPPRAKRTGATARAFARSRSAALDEAWSALEPLLP